jgi:hypothetical protein
MRRNLALVTLFAAWAGVAEAKTDEVRTGPIPSWAYVSDLLPVPEDARGSTFVRRQNVETHLDKTGQYTFLAEQVRLLDPNALKLGNLTLSWNPAAGSPVVHAVRVHRDGTVRDVLASTKFEVMRRENQLEQAMLDGVMTAVLRVPDLRVGDDLEFIVSLPSHDPTLVTDNYGLLYLGPTPPAGRYSLRVSWEKGQEPFVKATPDFAALLKKDENSVSLSIDNPPIINPPKDAPPRFAWSRVMEFSDFSGWKAVSSRMAPIFLKAQALPPGSSVKEEAARIASAYSNPKDRAAAALKLVQQQVRYVYVGLNGGNLSPASADETWQRRYGDCKGKTVLLLALLAELGIPAEAVLANNAGTDDGLNERLPTIAGFDHVLVRARIDGTTFWLDGTMPHVIPMSAEPVLPYRWVLPLPSEGADIERVQWKPASRPSLTTLYEIDAREGFTGPSPIKMTVIARGPGAIATYSQFSSLTEGQIDNAFRQEFEASEDWSQVDKVSWRFDVKEQASIVEITGKGPLEWEGYGKGSKELALPGGGFIPPTKRLRNAGQSAAVPYAIDDEFDCRVTTVRLPKATAVKDWSFNTTFTSQLFGQSYRRSFEKRDGAINMIRSRRTLETEISPDVATKDNALIAKFDNSKAVIFYDPNTADMHKPAETVPATYERDWVSDFSACLGPVRKK